MQKNINVSDRVAYQVPDFIREEDQQFVDFLFEYYKSQEKTGRPFDILNNVNLYLDVDSYSQRTLSAGTTLLKDIGFVEDLIEVESIDGFIEKDGSILIDNEVIYYESLTRGPDAILTPGISTEEFKKKEQLLESPFQYFDGTQNTFDLRFLGEPIQPVSADHLVVRVYGVAQIPGEDYYVEGDTIRFATPPRERLGTDDPNTTSIIYMVGFADINIDTLDENPIQDGSKTHPLRFGTQFYTPVSEVGLIVNRNGVFQKPFIDYVIYQTTDDGTYIEFRGLQLSSSERLTIRSIEYISPAIGSGAEIVSSVNEEGNLIDLIVNNGGSGYRLEFAPKVTITPSDLGGVGATARSLVGGVKNINLIGGGQGYTSYNPPLIEIAPPTDSFGTQATAELVVDDATGQVSSLKVTNSGSGYDFIPAVSFKNPSGATITDPEIDSEGRLVTDSISVTAGGLGYSNPPLVYIDPAPVDGIDAQAVAVLNPEGVLVQVVITNRGRGYTSVPRARIIQPVGAQVLGVTVASGSVTDIELLTGGRGYVDPPSVYIVDDRKDAAGLPIGGTGATAVATIFNGEITDISITNFGEGYDPAFPPKIYIAEPQAARASVDIGFDEVTGFEINTPGSGYKPSALVGCVRGTSGTISYDNVGNQIFATESQLKLSNHVAGAEVVSLDTLFLRQIFDKIRRQYLPTIQLDYTKVNPVQVIKRIRDFYASKGTKTATQFLFKVLFGEEVDVYYPRDEVISPSAASWVVDTILRATLIEGNPDNLIDGEIVQLVDEVDNNVTAASALIENVISIIKGTDTIYELAISEETLQGKFIIPYKTKLVEFLSETDQIITVDSTIGWPARNGTIRINDEEVVQYKERSLNQFIECTRSKNGVVEDWDPGTIVYSDIYVYVNYGTDQQCKLRILGIAEAGSTTLDDTGSYYLEGDKLTVASLGATDQDEKLSSWLYNVKKLISVESATPGGQNNQTATIVTTNPHGLLVEDNVTVYGANPTVYNGTFQVTARLDEYTFSYQMLAPTDIVPQGNILLSVDLNRGKSDVTAINTAITPFTSNIQNSFFNAQYVYAAATGLPNYKVGPFTGTALIPGNQRKLLRFPRTVTTVSKRETVKPNTAVGAWVNGVSVWSYKSSEFLRYGPLTSISITNGGKGYDAGNKPQLEISGGGGTGATAEVTVNGSLFSIEVTAGGSGYKTQPLVSVVGGGGVGATAQAVITGGRVSRVLVEQPGTGYTSQPLISITGGGGSGATATASVRGPISAVTLTNAGSGYIDLPSINLNSGSGALAQPIVINGRIVSIAIINSGSGYTTAPNVVINGDGFGAIAKAVIGTIGEDKGKVISVQILNKGINYTQGNTTIRLEAVGEFATFTPNVFQWTKNLHYDLADKYDFARGYVFTGYNNQFGGEYAHLVDPKELRYVVGDNVFLDPATNTFQEQTANNEHSPILGWAYDGNPIYGPYGYIDPTDQNSGLRRLRSSYQLKSSLVYEVDSNPNPTRGDGPPLSQYPAGTFVDDYEYAFQLGDLDPYNGRFCKTPEYPDGTYAYFVTIDESDAGQAVFPYILGPEFYSQPDTWNMNQDATQDNIPADVVRFRDPFTEVDIDVDRQPNREPDILTTELEAYPLVLEIQDTNGDGIIDSNEQLEVIELSEESTLQIYDYFPTVSDESRVDIEVETITKFESAQIDGFVIENPGVSYQVDDVIFFDNEGSGGFGASAAVSAVEGLSILGYQKLIEDDIVYGKITTDGNHELYVGDEVIVTSTVIPDNTNKTYYTKVVSGIEDIVIDQEGVGYNESIPPTYELITTSGQDAVFNLNVTQTGQITDAQISIINSGNQYDPENPPQVRVSHPQIFKKTRYYAGEYRETTQSEETLGVFNVNHSLTSALRYTYVCGSITKPDGTTAAWIAKFNDVGDLIWDRTLETIDGITKTARFKQMYLDERAENDIIYVVGETEYDNANNRPDILLVKYESAFDNANQPEGQVRYQKEISGVSGTTRRDYAMGITLGEEERVYICGYTDTNSPDPDDMWVIQMNEEGEMREKRKISSEGDDERMHQIKYLGDARYLFVGMNMSDYYMIIGEFFFDGNNIELSYAKNINISGGRPQNPRFTIDNYNDVYLTFDIFNNAIQKNSAVGIAKFAYDQINANEPTWDWYKTLAPSTEFVSITNADINIDIFGNVTLVTDTKLTENTRKVGAHYIKFDGEILKQSTIEDVDTVGVQATTHTVDDSGDLIIFGQKQKSDQAASYRFDGSEGTGGFISAITNITGTSATRGAGVGTLGSISAADQIRATNIGTLTTATAVNVLRAGKISTVGGFSAADVQRAGTVLDLENFSAAEARRGGAVNGVTNVSAADPKRGGVIASVNNIGAADQARGGRITLMANISAADPLRGGNILGVGNVSASDPSRTAGTYQGVTYTTSGSGVNATFDITVNGAGAGVITVTNGGISFAINETITVADSQLGGGGAPDLTFQVNAIGGFNYTNVAVTSTDVNSTGSGATVDVGVSSTGDVSLTVNQGGIGYYNGETLTISDSDIGASGAANPTFDVSGLGGFSYTNVASTNNGVGVNATFNVTIDGTGAATVVQVNQGGLAYAAGNTITISDSLLGNNGAANLTFDVATITAPATYTNVAATSTSGIGTNATFSVTIDASGAASIVSGTPAGLSYAVGDTITIADTSLGNSGAADLTFEVATIKAPPLYSNVATTTNGAGSGLTLQVTIAADGSVAFLNVTDPGNGYVAGDTITIQDADVGNTGAANITADVESVGGGAIYTVSTFTSTGSGTGATFNVTVDSSGAISQVNVLNSGNGFVANETVTIADSELGNNGGADFTFNVTATNGITYSGISTWTSSNNAYGGGTGAVFNIELDNLGNFTSLTPISRGANFVLNDTITIPDSQLGNTGAPDVVLTVASIEGHTYNGVSATTSGTGELATFNVVVDGNGLATPTVNNPGREYQTGDTFTITDAQLGNFGGANLTFEVTVLQGIVYSNISASEGSGVNASIDVNVDASGVVTINMNKTGRGYLISDTLRVTDAQLGGYGYSDITFDVQTTINVFDETKLNRGTPQYYNATDATIDAVNYKWGSGSTALTAANHYGITGFDLNTSEWTLQGWFRIDSATQALNNSQPTFFETHPNDGSNPSNTLRLYVDGDSGSADYGKLKLVHEGTTDVAVSVSATVWATFAAGAWVHVALSKTQPTLGAYDYAAYINGQQLGLWSGSTDDIGVDEVYVGGIKVPTTYTTLIGNIDDFVIDDDSQYSGASFTLPDTAVPIRTTNTGVSVYKIDRQHDRRGTFTVTDLTNSTSVAFLAESNWSYNSQTQPGMTEWEIGPGGLQILDYAEVTSQLTTGIYTFDYDAVLYGSKTSTVPSPGGKRLVLSPVVTPKYYIKDARYQKIDSVQELTFNQEVRFTKGQILQQYNDQGTTQRYGTIVEVPTGTVENPGLGTTYKIGNIFPAAATFNTTDKIRSTSATDAGLNVITGITFTVARDFAEWEQAASYTAGDQVYSKGNIYTATTNGTAGTNEPVHTTGNASDGGVSWDFTVSANTPLEVDLSNTAYPTPKDPLWTKLKIYDIGDIVYYGRNKYTATAAGRSSQNPPTHTTGTATDGTVTWQHTSTYDPLSDYATFKEFDAGENWYSLTVNEIYSDSNFIANDNLSIGGSVTVNPKEDAPTILQINGIGSVKEISLIAVLDKTILVDTQERTDLVYCVANSAHKYSANDILFTEGFSTSEFNGSFFVKEVFSSREFTFQVRETPAAEPAFLQNSIARVSIYTKHPTLLLIRNHNYLFDMSDSSNLGYYLSFSQDNEFKLEYSFNNIERQGTPGVFDGTNAPFVKLKVDGQVTNISYYFDPSRTGANSPVGGKSFIDVKKTPFDGRYTVSKVLSQNEFQFPLLFEPENNNAEIGSDDQGNPYSVYSTTSKRAIGPIADIKLISAGGFYQRLPIISDIASFRQIERVEIISGGSEYAIGTYDQVPINGDGEGGLCRIEVAVDEEIGSGTIVSVTVTDPGKGYTTASIDVDGIQGILGPTLTGSGADLSVIIPDEGTGASVFLTGKNIGKIKKLKNNEFGYGYSHDYTLKPEITFPINLQLFNTSILSQITITDPGAGYTSAPAVIIEGGGGVGAEAVAIVKNNRLSEIQIKNPGAGYSSEPVVTLKSEFNYVVNLDLNYLQFNFPHGITNGAAIQFRADDVGTTVGELPKPSSAGLTSLVVGQTYYAIAGETNSLEGDQLRFALTPADAESGNFITFLTQGAGRQVLLTEVFGGRAEAVVETSRFLEGEKVYQGDSEEDATVVAYVSENNGWQLGPKILKLVNATGTFVVGERVNGSVSRASGVIDNVSLAKGVLNIDSLTQTPGRFIDDVGKPSEIVQKIQDSFFYQNFSYVIKSTIPINRWREQILENNHPTGFNMFGQLQLTGGKDISGRKVGTEFIKQVNINEYTNVNQVTSFGAAQPIYTDFNNTEVLFRKKRLTNSEEILTSIVKKLDDVADQFDGIQTAFNLTVEGEQVIVKNNQLLITLNGIIQAPVDAYDIVGGQIVFKEAPKAPSKVVYRDVGLEFLTVTRLNLTDVSGIYPEIGYQISGAASDAIATVVASGTNTIDVVAITGGPFQNNERIDVSALGFSALIGSQQVLTQSTLYEFDETLVCTNRSRGNPTAQINAINLDENGDPSSAIVVSKTTGTAKYETGVFDFRLQDIVYSTRSNLAARITFLAPYRDPVTDDVVGEQILTAGSSFYGLLFERIVSTSYPNILLDDISKSTITPTELFDDEERINSFFLDFEEVRSTEVTYTDLSSGVFSNGDDIRNIKVFYNNPVYGAQYGTAANRYYDARNRIAGSKDEIIDFATAEIAVEHEDFYYPGQPQTDPRSRFRDGYRLIIKNKDWIVAKTYQDMILQYPSLVVPNTDKCKRDLGHFVDAVAYDTYAGGNKYARKFIQMYFTSQGLGYINQQLAETTWAYDRAATYMKDAITNQLSGTETIDAVVYTKYQDLTVTEGGATYGAPGTISNTDTGACADVQSAVDTLAEAITETLLGNQDFDDIDAEEPTYNATEEKCRRDVGYFVDGLAQDVGQGGNLGVVTWARFYFQNGTFISNGVAGEEAETITALNKARDLAKRAINNLLYVKDLTILNDPASYGGSAPGHDYDTNYASGTNQDATNCADVQSTIDTLTTIATTAINNQTLANINALSSIDDGSFRDGETVRVIKIAYKNKSAGLFNRLDSVRGVTSGATMSLEGVNSGLKWLFASSAGVSGTFQDDEYITNSTITNPGAAQVTQSVLNVKSDLANSTKSLKFVANSWLKKAESYDVDFGTGDFTLEGWFYPTGIVGQQTLFDFRRTATEGLMVEMNNDTLRVYSGSGTVVIISNAVFTANTWHHVAVVRTSGVMLAFVDGVQAGGSATNSDDFGWGPCYIGSNLSGSNGFIGNADQVAVYKGYAKFTSAFTAPTSNNWDDERIVLGLNAEQPFIVSTAEVYAQYSGQTVSSATAKRIDYADKRVIVEDIDLGRDSHRNAAELILKNDKWISEVAVGRMKAKYSDFVMPGDDPATNTYQGTYYCLRDTEEYILDAIVKDLKYGGDYYTTVAAKGYLEKDGSLDFIGKELLQSLYAWEQAGELCKYVVSTTDTDLTDAYTERLRIPLTGTAATQAVLDNIDALTQNILNILAPTGDRFRDAGDALWLNRTYIAEEVVGYIENKWEVTINGTYYDKLQIPGGNNGQVCIRDIKQYIIPAIIADLLTGGNAAVNEVIDFYLNGEQDILHVSEELLPMLDAISYTKYLSTKAINQLLVQFGQAPNPAQGSTNYDDYYIAQYTQAVPYIDHTVTVDPQGYDANRSDNNLLIDAADMIERNKKQIASEAVMRMNDLAKFQDLQIPGGQQNCIDDVVGFIEALVHDIRLGGNSKVFDAAELYIEPENNSLRHIESEAEASIYAYKMARDICVLAMRNGFGRDNIYGYGAGEENDPSVESYDQNPQASRYIDAANILDRNIRFIAEEAVYRTTIQYPSLTIPGGNINCVHDIADTLNAMVFNMKYGGNNMVYDAAEFYVGTSGLQHVASQSAESIYAFNQARDLAIQIMRAVPVINTGNEVHGFEQKYYDELDYEPYKSRTRDYVTLDENALTGGTTANRSRAADAYNLIYNNARWIAEGVVNTFAATNNWAIPGGNVSCIDDTERILKGVAYHVAYGGNSYVWDYAEEYTNSSHITGNQQGWTQAIFNYINSNILPDVIRNIQPVAASSWNAAGRTDLQQYRDLTITADVTQPACPTEVAAATTLLSIVTTAVVNGNMNHATRTVPPGGGACANVESTITDLFTIVTDTINNYTSLGSVTRTLPSIWPLKYTADSAERDLTITYDSAAASWGTTCQNVETTINGLFDIVLQTITDASAASPTNYLDSITRTLPTNAFTNTLYQQYTCYNVIDAAWTLFDLMLDSLGSGSYSNRLTAEFIRKNDHAITARAVAATLAQYPSGNIPDQAFAQDVLEACIYDIATNGNAGAFKLANEWFDGEGNFIAYPDIQRIRLLYCMNKVREYAKDVMFNFDDGGWALYDVWSPEQVQGYTPRLEWDQESTEFNMDSSFNCLEFSIERGTFPSDNVVTFVASTDAQNLTNSYNEGEDYNTDPALVLLTPTIEVGWEREENRVRINRTNFFRRGDVLRYVLASAVSLDGANDQAYYYVLNAEPQWFEISRMPKHDARFRDFALDLTNTGNQQFFTARRAGVTRVTNDYGTRDIQTPISAGFNIADVLVGTTTGASAEVSSTFINNAKIVKTFKYYGLETMSETTFIDGEQVVVQGAVTNNGYVMQHVIPDEFDNGWIKLETLQGTISDGDILEGITSGATATVTAVEEDRLLLNAKTGIFSQGDWLFKKDTATEAYIDVFNDKRGVLTATDGGRITMDVETINSSWETGDVIYGSITDKYLDLVGIDDQGQAISVNTYVHGQKVYKLSLSSVSRDTGYTGNFVSGDTVYLLQGTTIAVPGITATVSQWDNRPDDGVNDLYITSPVQTGGGNVPVSTFGDGGYNVGKFENLNNFPLIFASGTFVETSYSAYGKIAKIDQTGTTARCWLEEVEGDFLTNMTITSDGGWQAGVSQAKDLIGRVDRYFRGFDGSQTTFKLTIANGEQYLPDPAGHMLIFVNGILQPPGAAAAYTASSDEITFTEAPEVGSEFIGYYIGKLRQLDDISFEFDSLRSSFNLKYQGGFYSLTLTEGVSSNTILPENNIIVSLNGIIQEPGVGYEIVGSRIIFSEIPRAGTTFVAFSYIGSDADVIAATVVPPIEAGDQLFIEGENEAEPREVALIESSNSLVTFEYTGTVKGRNASALANIRQGTLSAAIITNPGNGYTARPNVDVISSSGFDGRVRAQMGVASIQVKTPGVGYALPVVSVLTTVADDFTSPQGAPINGGFDVYAGEAIDATTGETITIESGAIQITRQPLNITVNQGQTAVFNVIAVFNAADGDPLGVTEGLNYQWQKKNYGETDWNNIIGANQATYTTSSTIQGDDGDEYRVAITYAGATPVYSNSSVLTVQTGATVIANFDPSSIFAQ